MLKEVEISQNLLLQGTVSPGDQGNHLEPNLKFMCVYVCVCGERETERQKEKVIKHFGRWQKP